MGKEFQLEEVTASWENSAMDIEQLNVEGKEVQLEYTTNPWVNGSVDAKQMSLVQVGIPAFFADLSAGWFEERLIGLGASFEAAGFQKLNWCGNDDWWCAGGWLDRVLPTGATSIDFLRRLHVHLGNPTRLLIVGDSTLTYHFGEWVGDVFTYKWPERATFLAEAGMPPETQFWAVPGAWSSEFADQARAALRQGGRPDAILVVGGWNDRHGDPTANVGDLVEALK